MPQYSYEWSWQEAFLKFGFGDGDAWNGTHLIADFLSKEGYEVEYDSWGCHNIAITRLSKNGIGLLPGYDDKGCPIEGYLDLRVHPSETKQITYGYDDPETYLPADLVKKLNEHFHDDYEIQE